jgi:phosphotransferase system HPr-like phosphotransfer protein
VAAQIKATTGDQVTVTIQGGSEVSFLTFILRVFNESFEEI